MRYLILPALLATLTACSNSPVIKLYDGADQPIAQLATVRVPSELEIISINERRIEGASTMFAFRHRDLQFTPGEYRIVAFYKNVFDISADQHEVIKSDPALFTVNGAAGETIMLTFTKPESIEQAREMAKDFQGWTENTTSGERVASKPSGLILNQGFIGLALGAPQVQQEAATSITPAAPASQKVVTEGSSALQGLQENWNRAGAEERREFLLWMSQ